MIHVRGDEGLTLCGLHSMDEMPAGEALTRRKGRITDADCIACLSRLQLSPLTRKRLEMVVGYECADDLGSPAEGAAGDTSSDDDPYKEVKWVSTSKLREHEKAGWTPADLEQRSEAVDKLLAESGTLINRIVQIDHYIEPSVLAIEESEVWLHNLEDELLVFVVSTAAEASFLAEKAPYVRITPSPRVKHGDWHAIGWKYRVVPGYRA